MKIAVYAALFLLFVLFNAAGYAQGSDVYGQGFKINFDTTGKRFMRIINWHQFWLRYTENNPGSVINGQPTNSQFDVAIRRSRFIFLTQLTPRFRAVIHLGINNQTLISGGVSGLDGKKPQIFFHDVAAEYNVYKDYAVLGAGLHAWRGLSRITNASTISFLAYDAPIVNFFEIDAADQFARTMGFYLKGKVKKLDYRVSVNFPFAQRNNSAFTLLDTTLAKNGVEQTNYRGYGHSKAGAEGYFMYQFLDQESNQLPYMVGTYLGTKRVFNVGAGFVYYPDMMWGLKTTQNAAGNIATRDTTSYAMTHLGLDVFADFPLNEKKSLAVTSYAAGYLFNYGPNYIRTLGVANPAEAPVKGTPSAGQFTFSGAGNSLPLYGTGTVLYHETGLTLPYIKNIGRFQPYYALIAADYKRLANPVAVFDLGFNFFLEGHHAKITLNYRNRPVFDYVDKTQPWGDVKQTVRKSEFTMQFQVAL